MNFSTCKIFKIQLRAIRIIMAYKIGADACECGNEPSGSVKWGEFLDPSYLLKKDSAPWSKVSKIGDCYRNLFNKLEILLLKSHCIFSLILFVVNNKNFIWQILKIVSYIVDKVKFSICLCLISLSMGIDFTTHV